MTCRALLTLLLLTLPVLADQTPPTITVSGQAEVLVAPDRVEIRMRAASRHADPLAAERANAAVVQKVLAVGRAHGIKPDDIQTANLELSEETDEEGKKRPGYLAERTIQIRSMDPARVDDLVGALVKAGGNRIDSLSLETSDLPRYREQARIAAVIAARQKAESMAKALGQTIGPALKVTEVTDDPIVSGSNHYTNSVSRVGEDSPTQAVGRIAVHARVTIEFLLRP